MSVLKQITDSDFEDQVLQSDRPILVDFWAEWCGPCRAIAPTLEELEKSYGDRVSIVKLNVDENPDAAVRYGVQAIPTLILFKGGAERERLVGAQPKSALSALLDRHAA